MSAARRLRKQAMRSVLAGSALTVSIAGSVVLLSSSARADAEFNYDALTSANGVTTTLKNRSIPIGLTLEGNGPTSQAHLSSLGQSDAFASFPYPGDTVVGLPGLARAAILPGVPIPDYPFYVKSSFGSPPVGGSYPGGLTLAAESTQDRSTSKATVLSGSSGLVSESRVVETADEVVATSSSQANLLVFTGALVLSGYQSASTVRVGRDGKVVPTSSLSIGKINVPGLAVTLPTAAPSQIPIPNPASSLPQVAVPLPPFPVPFGGTVIDAPDIGFQDGQFTIQLPLFGGQKFALPADAALAAFKEAGFEVSYQAPVRTATGITSPSLSFRTILPEPPDNQFYGGPTEVTYNLGVTVASITGASVFGTGASGATASSAGTSGGSGSAAGVDGIAAMIPATGAVASGDPNLGIPAANLQPSDGRDATFTTAAFDAHRQSATWFYIVFAGVGLAGAAGSLILRYLGVRA